MKRFLLFLITMFQVTLYSQWTKVMEIPDVDILSVYSVGNIIYAGADSVIYISTNNGETWKPSAKFSNQNTTVSAIYKYNNIIFIGTYIYGVFISTDEGKSWSELNNGLNGLGAKYISDFEVRGDSIYVSTLGSSVFVMNLKEMDSWKTYNSNIPTGISGNTEDLFNHNNILFAAAGGNGFLYRNNYSTNSWEEIKFGEMTGEPNAMFDMASFDDMIIAGSTYGVYYSTDSGNTWEWLESEIGYINDVSIINKGEKLYIFLTKISGTYLYEFSKETKSLIFIEYISASSVIDAAIINNKLYAGKISWGLWYRNLTPTSIEDENLLKSFKISQNFPNPFNPSTSIRFSLPSDVNVKVEVYDILGNKISELLNEYKTAGEYDINFNGNNLSSGTYFYKILVQNEGMVLFNETKKMILIK